MRAVTAGFAQFDNDVRSDRPKAGMRTPFANRRNAAAFSYSRGIETENESWWT